MRVPKPIQLEEPGHSSRGGLLVRSRRAALIPSPGIYPARKIAGFGGWLRKGWCIEDYAYLAMASPV